VGALNRDRACARHMQVTTNKSKMAATKAATSRKEEVPLMTKKEKLKYGCFVTMVMLLWVSLAGVSLWSLDLARQSIKIVKDGP